MPPDRQQHYLIAVLGKTPQILTETLYALCVVRKIPIMDVFVITTQEGAQAAKTELLASPNGALHALKREYPAACNQIRFTEKQIFIAVDGLIPLPDIRVREDSEKFLELIMQLLWEKTALTNTTLHCSLAGGRKTMSTYMAMALQLLGRPQDMLYHVLVDPYELENHDEFYYPPAESKILELASGREFDISQAKIDLIEIPFIHLRERIQVDRHSSAVGYRQLLEWVQRDIDHAYTVPKLTLDPDRHRLIIGANNICLQPQQFCLYWYFADLSKNRSEDINVEDKDTNAPWLSSSVSFMMHSH